MKPESTDSVRHVDLGSTCSSQAAHHYTHKPTHSATKLPKEQQLSIVGNARAMKDLRGCFVLTPYGWGICVSDPGEDEHLQASLSSVSVVSVEV